MPSIREKQLEKRKAETLAAAMRLLMQHGYANLNMDDLAVEVGISKPTLYQYFTSKDELVAQALRQVFARLEAQLADLPDQAPLAQLQAFLRLTLQARAEQRLVMAPADLEGMRTLFQTHPVIKEHIRTLKARLTATVRQAQAAGEIDPSLPAWVVVNTMFSLQRVLQHPLDQAETPRAPEELAAAIEHLIALFVRGVRAPQAVPV
jgi:AcrR family transcriptional regulator